MTSTTKLPNQGPKMLRLHAMDDEEHACQKLEVTLCSLKLGQISTTNARVQLAKYFQNVALGQRETEI